MRFLALVVTAPALAFAFPAAATTSTGLHGLVTRGPVRPVCQVDQPCDEPAAYVKLLFVRDGKITNSARTDGRGRYRVALRPGRYSVRLARKPPIGRGLAPNTVRVLRGRFFRVDFFVDTGIR